LHVGVYDAPPPGIVKVKVGVPPFNITGEKDSSSEAKMETFAADQMTTLLFKSKRFTVIERAQLDQLLREQNLEGIVKSAELAQRAQIKGVDYLCLGKVTNLRVKSEKATRGFGIGTILSFFGIGGGVFDYKNTSEKIVTECGVDIRLSDPSSGEVFAADFGEYKRIDSIGAFGITVLGVGAQADADLQISEDDRGKILRLALDESVRKMLPTVDEKLVELAKERQAAAPPQAPAVAPNAIAPSQPPAGAETTAPAKEPAAAAKFCSGCGKALTANDKFCPGCGKAVAP
jgi:curli biogenesis system outer membrane secretion channel CsgG